MLSTLSAHKWLLTILSIFFISACGSGGGGGGGGGTNTDTQPNTFSFTAVTDISPSIWQAAPAVVISGINAATPVSISGGEYAINGADFTSATGSIRNGQSIIVRVMSSAEFSTAAEVTLTVGGVSATFTVTTVAEDTTPEAFSFTAATDIFPGIWQAAPAAVISGINTAIPVSISGGEYSINGADFTSAAGSITNGQSIIVRVMSSAAFSTAVEATLTLGGVAGTFTVTTEAEDATPEAFSLSAEENAEPATQYTSNAITVAGINTSVAISIESTDGGEYSIDSGDFTSATGTVMAGQSITLRLTSSLATATATSATLTLGGAGGEVDSTYTVTTLTDTTAPDVTIHFPPEVSLTEGGTVLVRGIASDDYSAITGIDISGIAAESDDGFATWTAEVPLSAGSNSLTATPVDAEGNENTSGDQVTVTQGALWPAFPNNDNAFIAAIGLELDSASNRLYFVDVGEDNILYVDTTTGNRTLLSSNTLPNTDLPFDYITGLTFDPTSARLFAIDVNQSVIFTVDTTTGERTVFSSNTVPNIEVPLSSPVSAVIDTEQNRLLVASESNAMYISVDLNTGVRSVFSSNTVPNGDIPLTRPWGLALDLERGRVLLIDAADPAVYAADSITGQRSILSNNTIPNTDNPFVRDANSVVVDGPRDRAIVSLGGSPSIYTVGLATGARSIYMDLTTPDSLNVFEITFDGEGDIDDLAMDNERQILYSAGSLLSNQGVAIMAIDAATGQRVILSKTLGVEPVL